MNIYRNTAEKTFDNYKLVLAIALRANLLMSRVEVMDKLSFTTDAVASQICHLMNWDYETEVVTDYLASIGVTFDDLEDNVINKFNIDRLRWEGIGE